MENKVYYASLLAIVPVIGLLGIPPVEEYLKSIDALQFVDPLILAPLLFLICAYVLKVNYKVAQYTDEFTPTILSLAAIVVCAIGLWIFPRLLILGVLGLIFSASWTRKNVWYYY